MEDVVAIPTMYSDYLVDLCTCMYVCAVVVVVVP